MPKSFVGFRALLWELQEDWDRDSKELEKALRKRGVSLTDYTIRRRISDLLEQKVMRRQAVVDLEALDMVKCIVLIKYASDGYSKERARSYDIATVKDIARKIWKKNKQLALGDLRKSEGKRYDTTVRNVYSITGEWDIVAEIVGPDSEEIGEFVADHIRPIFGVGETQTCTAFHRQEEHPLLAPWGWEGEVG